MPIRDVAAQRYIYEKDLIRKLAAAQKIIIGITPDNPVHHRITARIIDRLAAKGLRPAILLGNIERDKQNAFAIFRQRPREPEKPYDATGLDMLLGDSILNWTVARPVFDVAMLKNLPLKAVGLSRYEIGRIYRDGPGALPDDISKYLSSLLSMAPTKDMKQYLTSLITRDYCGKLPQETIEKFLVIHRAKSAFFALSLAQSADKISLLIVPKDYIMPKKYMVERNSLIPFMEQLGEKKKYTSLIFHDGKQDNIPPKKGVENADYIWTTDGTGRADPCGIFQTN